MLIRRRPAAGVTLIELMIGIVIFASLLGLAAPSFTLWLQNSQIRGAAESIQHGLHLAHTTAVHRNTVVYFRLMTSLTNTCTASPAGASWVVSLDDPDRACEAEPSDTVAPRIVEGRSGTEGSRNAAIAADESTIGFNGVGRRVDAATASAVNIDITNPAAGTCVAAGGEIRCLRVAVSVGGQVRLCDPSAASTDTRGC